jgi:hypothetical protein
VRTDAQRGDVASREESEAVREVSAMCLERMAADQPEQVVAEVWQQVGPTLRRDSPWQIRSANPNPSTFSTNVTLTKTKNENENEQTESARSRFWACWPRSHRAEPTTWLRLTWSYSFSRWPILWSAHATHTTHDTRHTTHDTRHTTHDTRHTTHDTRHTTHDTRHTTQC